MFQHSVSTSKAKGIKRSCACADFWGCGCTGFKETQKGDKKGRKRGDDVMLKEYNLTQMGNPEEALPQEGRNAGQHGYTLLSELAVT